MMGVPGGLGSECPVGAARWWLQHGEPPAHGNAAPKRHSHGFSLHSDNIRTCKHPITQHTHTYRNIELCKKKTLVKQFKNIFFKVENFILYLN